MPQRDPRPRSVRVRPSAGPAEAEVPAAEREGEGTSDPASAAFRIADYPFFRVARVGSLYTRCLDRALKPRGLDQPQWRVLMILREHDAAPMGTIAELAVMQLPTVVKLIQRMTRAGLVAVAQRERDRRIVEVRLTTEGRGALAHVRRAASAVYRRALAGLPPGDIDRVLAALARIEANLLEVSAPPDDASRSAGPAPSRRRRARPRVA